MINLGGSLKINKYPSLKKTMLNMKNATNQIFVMKSNFKSVNHLRLEEMILFPFFTKIN